MRLNQRGDTIVEVLMCMAVISAVLGGAYTFTNSNTKNTQQAQEHAQALKVAETQVEQLKSYTSKVTPPTPLNNFCMKYIDPNLVVRTLPSADCLIADGSIANRYSVAITSVGQVYTVTVRWLGPTSKNQQVSLSYRAY